MLEFKMVENIQFFQEGILHSTAKICNIWERKDYIHNFHYWCRQHNFLLKCWETWKRRLFQESMLDPTTPFSAIYNKKFTFNCCLNDVGNTIFFQNAEKFQKRQLFQENIFNPTTPF